MLTGREQEAALLDPRSGHNALCAWLRWQGSQQGYWEAEGFIEATDRAWEGVAVLTGEMLPSQRLWIVAGWDGGAMQVLGTAVEGRPQVFMYNAVGVHFEPAWAAEPAGPVVVV